MKELDEARLTINRADETIAAAFSARMRAVEEIAAYKQAHGLPVYDAAREAAVLQKGAAAVESDLRPYYLTVLQSLLDVSKQYQHRLFEGARVSYSGVPGAFAHTAATRIFPTGEKVSCPDFEAAYRAVEKGECDAALLPIENSYAGEVGQVLDLMLRGNLFVNGVYEMRVSQNLVGVKGARAENVRRVISHPQALGQCDRYIRAHGFATENAENTARAAKAVADLGDPTVAAVAGAETAALYGLEILDKNINENAENTTRFAVFSRAAAPGGGKDGAFILLFTVNNVAGALAKALNIIGAYGFNMRVLRSRPLRDHAWQYYFYVEAEGDDTTPEGQKMLRQLATVCDLLKVVGHFTAEQTVGEDAVCGN